MTAPHPIGGTTTPAPEASLAGAFLSSTCPASPVGVPGDAGAFSTEKDARLARLRAGHAAHFAWSDDTIAAIKRMAAEAVDVTNIAKRLGLHVKTLRNRAPRLGIDLIGEARRRQARGDEVLRRLYPTDADIDTVHAAWVEAIGEQRSRIAMRSRAVHINLRRDTETPVARVLRANRARQGRAEVARREKAAAIQRDIDAGATRGEILVTHKVARETLRQMTRGGLVTFPPVVAVVKPPKPSRQVVVKVGKVAAPNPVKVRQAPPPVVLRTDSKPTPPAVIDAPAAPPALPEPDPRTGRIYAPFATIRALAAYHGFIYDGSNMDRMNRVRAAMNQPLLVQDDACGATA